MGYRIDYGQTITKIEVNEADKKPNGKHLVKAILVGCVLLFLAFVWGKERVRAFFIPGDPDITEYAAKCFVEDVRNGEPIVDAFTDFCLEIIDNAGIEE